MKIYFSKKHSERESFYTFVEENFKNLRQFKDDWEDYDTKGKGFWESVWYTFSVLEIVFSEESIETLFSKNKVLVGCCLCYFIDKYFYIFT